MKTIKNFKDFITESKSENKPVKKLSKKHSKELHDKGFPNFSSTGSIIGMKQKYYGKNALLVKCDGYIYNVSSEPEIYNNAKAMNENILPLDFYNHHGRYINLEVIPPHGNLKITLTDEGREELLELKEGNDPDGRIIWTKNVKNLWYDLLEDIAGNSTYRMIEPHEIGALTDAPIIGYEVGFDDDGKIEENEDTRYWWFTNYMVEDEFQSLLDDGEIIFTAASK